MEGFHLLQLACTQDHPSASVKATTIQDGLLDGKSGASLVLVLLMLVPLPGEDEGLLAGLKAVVSYPGLEIPGFPGP